MKLRNVILSILAIALISIIVLSSTATIVQAIDPIRPPRGRPIPPSGDPNNDPPKVKHVTLPDTITETYIINGEHGTVVITGRTTLNLASGDYRGIVILNATKIVFKNVYVNVAFYISYLTAIYIDDDGLNYNERIGVTGDSLVINVGGEVNTYSYTGFKGLYARSLKSFSLGKLIINYSPKIQTTSHVRYNNKYHYAGIDVIGADLKFYGYEDNKASYYIGTFSMKFNPKPIDDHTVIFWAQFEGLKIRSYGSYRYYRSSDPIQTFAKGTIRYFSITKSSISAYYFTGITGIYVRRTDIALYYFTISDISITRPNIVFNKEDIYRAYSTLYGIDGYRSRIYVGKFLGSNVIMKMMYNEAYLFDYPRLLDIKYRYIVTRSFGVGPYNVTGGIFPIWYKRGGPIEKAGRLPVDNGNNGDIYEKVLDISHVFLRDTPAAIGPTGLKSLGGYISIITKNSGFAVIFNDNGEGLVYRGSIKNSRISISLRQSYDKPVYGTIILYTQNMITLMIFGKDIKISINGKLYTADVIVLSSSDAYIKGRVFITRGDGSTARIFQRYGMIAGIYTDYVELLP